MERQLVSMSGRGVGRISEISEDQDQLRISDVSNFVFFHFEYHDSRGKTYLLPGQMRGKEGYTWSESEVEPILVEIMNSITLNEESEPTAVCVETDGKTEKTIWQRIKKIIS